MIPGFGLVAMLAFAVFYYRLGEQEYSSGILLAAASIVLWLGAGYFLGFGMLEPTPLVCDLALRRIMCAVRICCCLPR